jgi:hypothetical protein
MISKKPELQNECKIQYVPFLSHNVGYFSSIRINEQSIGTASILNHFIWTCHVTFIKKLSGIQKVKYQPVDASTDISSPLMVSIQ